MRPITERRFWDLYRPLLTPEGDALLEHAQTLEYPLERVWSVVEGFDPRGNLYASPGYHVVNVLGYVVTEEPWTDETRDAVYHAV